MKRFLSFVLLLMILAGGMAFARGGQASGAASTVKIGMIFPFSGGNADQGVFNRYGAELAVEKINAAGGIKSLGGRKLEVIFYDNQSSSDVSRAVAERLLAEHPDIVAASGAGSSGFVLPMLASFERARVPFLTAQTSETLTSQGYQYVFVFGCQATQFSRAQLEMIQWLNQTYNVGISRVGILYEDTEVGSVNSQSSRDLVATMPSLNIVYDQRFQPNASDLSSVVIGMMNAGVEVVLPTAYSQDAKLLYNTMAQYRYSPLVIGAGAGFLYPAFATDLGDLVNGLLSTATHNYDIRTIRQNSNPAFNRMGEDYEAKNREFMPEQAVSAFNAVYIISQALENTGSTDSVRVGQAIRALTINSFAPGGPLNFNSVGWNRSAVAVMVQWQKDRDGLYRPHTVFPPTEATAEFQIPEFIRSRMR
jgi:branched-chain amino acid transport system substrate-binding protein